MSQLEESKAFSKIHLLENFFFIWSFFSHFPPFFLGSIKVKNESTSLYISHCVPFFLYVVQIDLFGLLGGKGEVSFQKLKYFLNFQKAPDACACIITHSEREPRRLYDDVYRKMFCLLREWLRRFCKVARCTTTQAIVLSIKFKAAWHSAL